MEEHTLHLNLNDTDFDNLFEDTAQENIETKGLMSAVNELQSFAIYADTLLSQNEIDIMERQIREMVSRFSWAS